MKRLCLALLTFSCISTAMAQDATIGSWSGLALQVLRDGRTLTWTVEMRIDSREQASIAYPSLNCGGTLTYLRSVGDIREYHERLTYGHGRCTDNGIVGVHPKLGKLVWYWLGEGTTNPTGVDVAVLSR